MWYNIYEVIYVEEVKKKDTLVNRERYSSTFDKELLYGLKKLSKDTGIPITKLLDKSIELLLDFYKSQN